MTGEKCLDRTPEGWQPHSARHSSDELGELSQWYSMTATL